MRGNITRTCSPDSPLAGWELGDVFQNFFAPSYGARGSTKVPSLDLKEDADGYTLALDVPGYTMDRIDVQFADNVLTLAAENVAAAGDPEGAKKADEIRWHVTERSTGAFIRSVKFPVPVEAANVKASLKNGVLTVVVPKAIEAKAQKIKITES